jgi:hypothetical protein
VEMPFEVRSDNFQFPATLDFFEESANPGPSSYLPQEVSIIELTVSVAKPIKNSFFIISQV